MDTTEIMVDPSDLVQSAKEFNLAKQRSQEIIENLDKVCLGLESQWAGAAQQVFYTQYREWRQIMAGMVLMLGSIAQELHSMADRLEKADH